MKAFKRVLIKILILLTVVLVAGGAAASWQAYRQSTAEYAVGHYLSLLIDNSSEKAYACLDQSEEGQELALAEYGEALTAKKYSLYASYEATELEKRRDNDGREYVDYHVKFQNAAGETQAEEDFTVKKQPEQVLGLFDRWKVLSGHCMVKNYRLTVPAGSQVYLNAEKADPAWITREGVPASSDCYEIPSMVPGKVGLVIRHPALESVNATLDTADGSADYTDKMPLKDSAKSECTEMGVNLLKEVYSLAVKKDTEGLELLKDCKETAKQLIKEQNKKFDQADETFRNVAISNFAAQFGALTFTEEETGAITTEMTFSYHYAVRTDVTVDVETTDEEGNTVPVTDEEGNPVREMEPKEESGDATAKLTMAFFEDAWHIAAVEMEVIP